MANSKKPSSTPGQKTRVIYEPTPTGQYRAKLVITTKGEETTAKQIKYGAGGKKTYEPVELKPGVTAEQPKEAPRLPTTGRREKPILHRPRREIYSRAKIPLGKAALPYIAQTIKEKPTTADLIQQPRPSTYISRAVEQTRERFGAQPSEVKKRAESISGRVIESEGYFQPTEGAITIAREPSDVTGKLRTRASKLASKAKKAEGFQRQFMSLGAVGITAAAEVTQIFEHPIKSLYGTLVGPVVLGKELITRPYEVGGEFGRAIRQEPETIVGTIAAGVIGPKLVSKAIPILKKGYIKVGAKKVSPSEVFAPEVLAGEKTLPLSESIKQTQRFFKEAKGKKGVIVSTAAPQALKGDMFTGVIEVGAGKKGAAGLEDIGIYVTPKGKGSPYFLRIADEVTDIEYTLNPFKGISRQPTITEISVSDVVRIPKKTIKEPGFIGPEMIKFQKEAASRAQAIITKRSEIGLGEVPRQKFRSIIEAETPIPLRVIREGKEVRLKPGQKIFPGDIIREAGTTELEAVIPAKSRIVAEPRKSILGKIKGFEEYTEFLGEPVAIRKARTIPIAEGIDVLGQKKVFGELISPEKIRYETELLSSVARGKKYVTPYPEIIGTSIKTRVLSEISEQLSKTAFLDEVSYIPSAKPSKKVRPIMYEPIGELIYPIKEYRPTEREIPTYRPIPGKRPYTPFFEEQRGISGISEPKSIISIELAPKPKKKKVVEKDLFRQFSREDVLKVRKEKVKPTKFKPRYMPSVEAVVLKIAGKKSRLGEISGLQLRPIVR